MELRAERAEPRGCARSPQGSAEERAEVAWEGGCWERGRQFMGSLVGSAGSGLCPGPAGATGGF